MAIINQHDKRSGITYVYESRSFWDKEKQQSRSKRTLIGRRDPSTGEIVPTDGRGRRRKKDSLANAQKEQGSSQFTIPNRFFFGATYLLDQIGEKLGLIDDLKACFPHNFKQILSLAYYLVLESDSPMFRFEKWGQIHKHPYADNIPSQRVSEIFSGITEEQRQQFFVRQLRRRSENEYWAYDSTSISSYSQSLRQVQYGRNKEDDRLPQINLALVFGEESGLPFYYRKLAGNIPDVATVKSLLSDFQVLGYQKIKLVMDRGFYSEANVNNLLKERMKFILGMKRSTNVVRDAIEAVYDSIKSYDCLDEQHGLYAQTVRTEWRYKQLRPYKNDVLSEKRRVYLHVYFNMDQYAEDCTAFDKKLLGMRRELLNGKYVPEHEPFYRQYFDIKETPARGIQVSVKEDAVQKNKRYYGFFVLMTNEKMDAITAMQLYRNKDLVEKAFGNIKDRLNLRRLLVSSEKSLDGKIFVAFIALMFVATINKQMHDAGLFQKYTVQTLLDKLDVIECFQFPGHELRVGEILNNQRQIYSDLGISPPA